MLGIAPEEGIVKSPRPFSSSTTLGVVLSQACSTGTKVALPFTTAPFRVMAVVTPLVMEPRPQARKLDQGGE